MEPSSHPTVHSHLTREEAFAARTQENIRSGMLYAVISGSVLFLAFYILDLIQAPEQWGTFLTLRVATVAVLLVLGFVGSKPSALRYVHYITFTCFYLAGVSIAFMCVLLNGHTSSYYPGLIMVLVAVVLIPWRAAHTLITCGSVLGSWVLLLLLFDPVPFSQWQLAAFANSLVFILGTSCLSTIASYFSFRLREREFHARFEQDRANVELKIVNEHLARQSEELEAARSQLERNYKELEATYQHKSQFLDMMSHELRTPLTCILTPLEGLLSGDASGKLRAILRDMHRASMQLYEQISSILDVSRYEKGEVPLNLRDFDLVSEVQEHLYAWYPVAEQKGIELIWKSPSEQIVARVDRREITKVIRNLISNAIKFTRQGGKVIVELEDEDEDDTVALTVRDTGIGIPKEELTNVFKPFVQVDTGDTRSAEGTGIGLALTEAIVLRHGGRIELSSEIGQGSIFRVTLPRGESDKVVPVDTRADELPEVQPILIEDEMSTADEVPASDVEPIPVSTRALLSGWIHHQAQTRREILVVEDDQGLTKLVKSLLEPYYDVRFTENGEEGLAQARAKVPDLIISDVMMSKMSGFEMVEALRREPDTERVPIILLTARATTEDKLHGLTRGADDYLTKPFNQNELLARVSNLLRRREYETYLTSLNEQIVLRSGKLGQELRRLYMNMVRTLVAAVDAKDYYTGGHSERVAFFSVIIGKHMGLNEAQLRTLELGALLHDIGKIGIPDMVLNKAGALSPGEVQLIREHAKLSGMILAKAPELNELRRIAVQHHERWDGSGYPHGLRGEQICLASRIVGVADCWDAMISDRVYRKGMDAETALEKMVALSGTDFDPQVIAALEKVYPELTPPPDLRPLAHKRPRAKYTMPQVSVQGQQAGDDDDDSMDAAMNS